MRRNRTHISWLGAAAIVLGVVILLALILPSGFWWFLIGVGLIVFGLCSCRRCN